MVIAKRSSLKFINRDHEENLLTSTKFVYETYLRPHLSFKKKLIKSINSKTPPNY